MKNLLKLFGIIAIVAVIGFGMTACKEGGEPEEFEATTAGELTITGITGHDGEEVTCENTSGLRLIGYERATNWYRPDGDNSITGNAQWARISSGQLVFKIFKIEDQKSGKSGGYQSYTGNDQNVTFRIGSFSTNFGGTLTVNFTNGKATVNSSAIVVP
jgi:hypothetical protein